MGVIFSFCAGEETVLDEDGNIVNIPRKYVGKDWLTDSLKEFLAEKSAKNFLSLAKAKKIILTQEQKAAMEKDYDQFAENNPNDLLPADFEILVSQYLVEDGLMQSVDGLKNLMSIDNMTSIVDVLKNIGQVVAPFTPAPDTVGKMYGQYSKGEEMQVSAKPPPKPEEALHFKAIDSGILDRYQSSLIYERRPSVSALPCQHYGCSYSTFNLSGFCKEHHENLAEKPEFHIEKLTSGELDLEKLKHVEKSLSEKPPTSTARMSDKLSSPDLKSKSAKALENFIKATELRKG